MKNAMQKLTALLLAMLLLCGMLPMSTFAATGTPVSISALPLTLIENNDISGWWYDGEDGKCFYYDYGEDVQFVLTFEDGSTFEWDRWTVYSELGAWVEVADDQEENPWGLGTHTATATLGELECELEVEIIETPVESIEVEPVDLIFECEDDGEWCYETDEETGEEIKWFEYDNEPRQISVLLKDGRTLSGKMDDVVTSELGNGYFYTTGGWANEPWGLGEYTSTLWLAGHEVEYTVNVIETPVESIEARQLYPIYEEGLGYWDDTAENPYFYYTPSSSDFEFTVKMKDGTTYTGNGDEVSYQIEKDGKYGSYWFWFADEQSEENVWTVGDNDTHISFMGYTADVTVTISENPYTDLSIKDEDGELVITLTGANGEKLETSAIWFYPFGGDEFSTEGELYTGDGTFTAVITYDKVNERQTAYEGVNLSILGLESNKLESSAWIDAELGSWFAEFTSGDVDDNDVVDVADIMKLKALIMADDWNNSELVAGDVDDSGSLDVGDIMAIKNIIMSA